MIHHFGINIYQSIPSHPSHRTRNIWKPSPTPRRPNKRRPTTLTRTPPPVTITRTTRRSARSPAAAAATTTRCQVPRWKQYPRWCRPRVRRTSPPRRAPCSSDRSTPSKSQRTSASWAVSMSWRTRNCLVETRASHACVGGANFCNFYSLYIHKYIYIYVYKYIPDQIQYMRYVSSKHTLDSRNSWQPNSA